MFASPKKWKVCPVGKQLGVEGIGEGIVWKANYNGTYYFFKTKGEKHSVTKITKIAAIDTEMVANVREFVENTVTENRLQQGVEKLIEMKLPEEITSMGNFIRWISNDVIKEESDTISNNHLDAKIINSQISTKARAWFSNHLNNMVFNSQN